MRWLNRKKYTRKEKMKKINENLHNSCACVCHHKGAHLIFYLLVCRQIGNFILEHTRECNITSDITCWAYSTPYTRIAYLNRNESNRCLSYDENDGMMWRATATATTTKNKKYVDNKNYMSILLNMLACARAARCDVEANHIHTKRHGKVLILFTLLTTGDETSLIVFAFFYFFFIHLHSSLRHTRNRNLHKHRLGWR